MRLTFAIVLAFLRILGLLRTGAPWEGCKGTPGSGVTVWTGLSRFFVRDCKLINLLSHIDETSAIRWTTFYKIICYIYLRKLSPSINNIENCRTWVTKALVSGVMLSLNSFSGLFNWRVSAVARNELISVMLFKIKSASPEAFSICWFDKSSIPLAHQAFACNKIF